MINMTVCLIVPVYQIILGTIDNADSADVEWVYRPYMNTAKKRRFLTDEWRCAWLEHLLCNTFTATCQYIMKKETQLVLNILRE